MQITPLDENRKGTITRGLGYFWLFVLMFGQFIYTANLGRGIVGGKDSFIATMVVLAYVGVCIILVSRKESRTLVGFLLGIGTMVAAILLFVAICTGVIFMFNGRF